MTGAIVILALYWTPLDGPSLPQDHRAAEIAYLRFMEKEYGKTAYWQWVLRSSREAVTDPLFTPPATPVWLHEAHQLLLDAFPVLLLLAAYGGAYLVQRAWFRHRLTEAAGVCILWFAILYALHLAVRPGPGLAAVVRVDGVVVRQGNGLSYPAQTEQGFPIRLSAGVEAVVRTRRPNGWVQVELPRGVLGWVPQDAIYLVEKRGHG